MYLLPAWYLGSPSHKQLRTAIARAKSAVTATDFCDSCGSILARLGVESALRAGDEGDVRAIVRRVLHASVDPSTFTNLMACFVAAAVSPASLPKCMVDAGLRETLNSQTVQRSTRWELLAALACMAINGEGSVLTPVLPLAVHEVIDACCTWQDAAALAAGLRPDAALEAARGSAVSIAAIDGLLCLFTQCYVDKVGAAAAEEADDLTTMAQYAFESLTKCVSSLFSPGTVHDASISSKALLAIENISRTCLRPFLGADGRCSLITDHTLANAVYQVPPRIDLHVGSGTFVRSLLGLIDAIAACLVRAVDVMAQTSFPEMTCASLLSALGSRSTHGLRFPAITALFLSSEPVAPLPSDATPQRGAKAWHVPVAWLAAFTDRSVLEDPTTPRVHVSTCVRRGDPPRVAAVFGSVAEALKFARSLSQSYTTLSELFKTLKANDLCDVAGTINQSVRQSLTAAVFDLLASSFPSGIMFSRAPTVAQCDELRAEVIQVFTTVHSNTAASGTDTHRQWYSTILHRLREALSSTPEAMLASLVKTAATSPSRAGEVASVSAADGDSVAGGPPPPPIELFLASLRQAMPQDPSPPLSSSLADSLVLGPAGASNSAPTNFNLVHNVLSNASPETGPAAADAADSMCELRAKYCSNLAALLLAVLGLPLPAAAPAIFDDHATVLDDLLDAITMDDRASARRRRGRQRSTWVDKVFILDIAAGVAQVAVRRFHSACGAASNEDRKKSLSTIGRCIARLWTVAGDQYIQFALEHAKTAPGAGAPTSFSTRLRAALASQPYHHTTAAAYARSHGLNLHTAEILLSVEPPAVSRGFVRALQAISVACSVLQNDVVSPEATMVAEETSTRAPKISPESSPIQFAFERLCELCVELAWPASGRLQAVVRDQCTTTFPTPRVRAEHLQLESQLQAVQLLCPLLPLIAQVLQCSVESVTFDSLVLRHAALRGNFRSLWALLVWHDLPMIARCAAVQMDRTAADETARRWGYMTIPGAIEALARWAPPLLRFRTNEYVPAVTSFNGFAAAVGVSATPTAYASAESVEALVKFVGHERLIRHVDITGRINAGQDEYAVLRQLAEGTFDPFPLPTAPAAVAAWPVIALLPFGEVFLLRALIELEILRASAGGGSFALPMTYMDYDVKQFAAGVHSKAANLTTSSAAGATALAATGWSGPSALVILIRSAIERAFQIALNTAATLPTRVRMSRRDGILCEALAPPRSIQRGLTERSRGLTLPGAISELLAILGSRDLPHTIIAEAQSTLDNIVYAGVNGPAEAPSFSTTFRENMEPIVRVVLEAAAAWDVRYGNDGGVAAVNRVAVCANRWMRLIASDMSHRSAPCRNTLSRQRKVHTAVATFLMDGVRDGNDAWVRIALSCTHAMGTVSAASKGLSANRVSHAPLTRPVVGVDGLSVGDWIHHLRASSASWRNAPRPDLCEQIEHLVHAVVKDFDAGDAAASDNTAAAIVGLIVEPREAPACAVLSGLRKALDTIDDAAVRGGAVRLLVATFEYVVLDHVCGHHAAAIAAAQSFGDELVARQAALLPATRLNAQPFFRLIAVLLSLAALSTRRDAQSHQTPRGERSPLRHVTALLLRWFSVCGAQIPFASALTSQVDQDGAECTLRSVEHIIHSLLAQPEGDGLLNGSLTNKSVVHRRQSSATAFASPSSKQQHAVVDPGLRWLLLMLLRHEHSRIVLWVSPDVTLAARAVGVAMVDEAALVGVGPRYDQPWTSDWAVMRGGRGGGSV
jgi:hypothetical protein